MAVRLIIAYALPTLATQFVYAPFTTVLPGIYAKYFGLSAASIAAMLLISRACDAVSDPLIGYLSDATRSRLGRRKPWIAVGTLITALALWEVVAPPDGIDAMVHFGLWSVVFYLGWTMMEIPHTAWGSELTDRYESRNQVFFARTVFAIVGPLLFAAVPVVIQAPSTEMTPQTMRAVAVAFLVGAPVLIGVALVFAPHVATGPDAPSSSARMSDALKSIGRSILLWRLVGVFVLGGLAAGVNGTLQFIYVDAYLSIGDMLPYALGAMMVSALLGLPLWLLVVQKVDKHKAWAVSLGLASVWVVLPATLTPGEESFPLLLVMVVGLALSSGAGAIVPFALLADVIDYDELRTGHNHAGAYFAVFLFGVKLNAAIGGSIGFGILALVGFDAAASEHTTTGILGLKSAFAIVPAVLFLAAGISVYRFPLDRRRHDIVRRALARRADRMQVTDPPATLVLEGV